jgi:glutamate dehydrogenase (NAD(P)+)
VLSLIDEWGPEKVVMVSDRKNGMRGVLVIDNTARGMGKGGTRMAPGLTIDEVARLARVMTWKWAAADLFFGGAKAGIRADPVSPDKEAILRSFVRKLSNEVPREYVFGLDMGLTEYDAAIIEDELGRGTVIGTPSAIGGLPYDEWGVTGFGVAEAAETAASHTGTKMEDAATVVQGFGAVGRAAALRCAELGARVVCVSNIHGAIYDPDGLDVGEVVAAYDEHGENFFDAVPRVQRLAAGDELALSADILIPAATQDVIDAETARRLDVSIVVEGANLPTSAESQSILASRDIVVVSDFIANAGGVIAGAFAMDARGSAFATNPSDVFDAVSTRIRANTLTVLETSTRTRETTHVTARNISQQRVLAAMDAKSRSSRLVDLKV